MLVVYDHREKKSGVPGLLVLQGLELESAQLPIGDYIVSDRMAIERKSPTDFAGSLRDGRLFEQADRLRGEFGSALILIEGDPPLKRSSVDGAIGSLLRRGVSVLRVADTQESAEWIARLARQEAKGHGQPRGRGPRKAALTPLESARLSLAMLPGISATKADRLLEHFGSLKAVTAAAPEELKEVEGIGKVTARRLAATFAAVPGATPFD